MRRVEGRRGGGKEGGRVGGVDFRSGVWMVS